MRKHLKIVPIEQINIHGRQSSTYKDFITHLSGRKFDLFIVDGPHGNDFYSRYQIVEIAKQDIMDTDFIFVIDDYDRDGEKQTVGDLRDVFRSRGILFHESVYSGDKDSLLICSPKYSFLTSL